MEISIHEAYDDFLMQFESAVPPFHRDRAAALIERKATWSEVIAAAASAPHDFLLYWKLDLTPLECLDPLRRRHIATGRKGPRQNRGDTWFRQSRDCRSGIPSPAFRYRRGSRFAIDQPSTVLSSLGRNEITQVAQELDRKLASLFDVLRLAMPASS